LETDCGLGTGAWFCTGTIRSGQNPLRGARDRCHGVSECQVLAEHAGGERTGTSDPLEYFCFNSRFWRVPHHVLRSFAVLLGAVLLHWRRKLHPSGVTPSEALPTPLKAGKIAAACGAAVRRRADSQKKRCPLRWTIVLFAPCRELLTVATGTPRVFPRALGPYTGLPACAAARAAQGINADDSAQNVGYRSPMRYARFATPAFGASKLHFFGTKAVTLQLYVTQRELDSFAPRRRIRYTP
jgi:hypothetical protein